MKPYLARIFIYPIKSLDRIEVKEAKLLKSGAIEGDREWCLVDEKGKFVNGKRDLKIHFLRANFDDDCKNISLQIEDKKEVFTFNLEREKPDLEAWLSNFFDLKIKLIQNTLTGFPDDTKANGPTIISTATLKEVASWYENITVEEMRQRLRSNLEIDGVPAFWEDRLFATEAEPVKFKIGDVLFNGINPCARCIVPTRDSLKGISYPNFQKIFISKRKETLPDWVNRDRFNHFYRLSVNTIIPDPEAGKILRCKEEIII